MWKAWDVEQEEMDRNREENWEDWGNSWMEGGYHGYDWGNEWEDSDCKVSLGSRIWTDGGEGESWDWSGEGSMQEWGQQESSYWTPSSEPLTEVTQNETEDNWKNMNQGKWWGNDTDDSWAYWTEKTPPRTKGGSHEQERPNLQERKCQTWEHDSDQTRHNMEKGTRPL